MTSNNTTQTHGRHNNGKLLYFSSSSIFVNSAWTAIGDSLLCVPNYSLGRAGGRLAEHLKASAMPDEFGGLYWCFIEQSSLSWNSIFLNFILYFLLLRCSSVILCVREALWDDISLVVASLVMWMETQDEIRGWNLIIFHDTNHLWIVE